MEVLLLAAACAWLVHTAGAQSEQAKMGLSPAQRDILKERARHEKAVHKIADKHGVAAPAHRTAGVSPWKEPPASERDPVLTLPEAFRSGYRGHTRVERVATPMGRRAGGWAARGVAWGEDTGRGALREYRRRRRAAGHDDPAPLREPLPLPPDAPPIPAHPPTAGTDSGKGVSLEKPKEETGPLEPDGTAKPSEGVAEPPAGGDDSPGVPEASTGPETPPDGAAQAPAKEPAAPAPEASPAPEGATAGPETKEAVAEPEPAAAEPEPAAAETKDTEDPKSSEGPLGAAETEPAQAPAEPEPAAAAPENAAAGPENPAAAPESPAAAPEGTTPGPIRDSQPAVAGGGVGRMAAEVSYESVEEESDELSLMCEDDLVVYGRIGKRCKREISKADDLLVAMEAVGFGPKVMSWVTRGKEQYGVIDSQLDELKSNTSAQGEAVVKAKALLVAGQGLYAGIAKDMESVADREVYISDAVDAEDTSAHTETYETRGA